jgi:hypothetical protein
MQRHFFSGTLLLSCSIVALSACGGGEKTSNSGNGGATGQGGSSANGGTSNPGSGGITNSLGGSGAGGTTPGSGGTSGTSRGGGTSTSSGGSANGGSSAGGGGNAKGGASSGGSSSGGSANGGSGGGTPAGESVLERNNHPSRNGHFQQPALTKAAVAKMSSDTGFKADITNKSVSKTAMFSSPLYLANGPGGKGLLFATTTGNDVFAVDASTGAQVWVKNIGASPTANGVSCGNIHPLGILSTPVIDATARTIYAVGAIGTTSIQRFELHALNVDDGMERAGYPIDLTKIPSDSMANIAAHNQRGALSLVNGVLYVPFGGHVGDCGNYKGRVIAVDTKDPTKTGAWATRHQGEAIWAPGGLASDGNGVFAITGNYTPFGQFASSRDGTDSEEVLRLTGLATLTRNNQNLYYASDWQNMDRDDADFGAMNPMVINVAGSTPSSLVVAIAKDGRIHLLDAANIGGADGKTPLQNFQVASGVMSIHTVPASYKTATGTFITFSTDSGAMCPSGQPSGKVVMGVQVTAGAPPSLKVAWCAALSGTVTAPIATTSDGTADALVWFISGTKLTAVDGETGAVVYTSADNCASVSRWTSPIAAGGHIVVGANDKLCSWSPH